MPYDDLLRSQVVYAVSAFDKLIHDLVRIGMVQIFSGARPATAKYLSESILRIIVVRRNAIVHEADIDPTTNAKPPITQVECREITDFLQSCGTTIAGLVT